MSAVNAAVTQFHGRAETKRPPLTLVAPYYCALKQIEYFISDDDDIWEAAHQEWLEFSWNWLISIGLREELMGRDVHPKHKLAHYARACTDITFR